MTVRNRIDIEIENERKWKEHYQRLLAFVEREGHCRVPARYVEDGFGLGRWVRTQRTAKDKLTADRYRALEAVEGWHWSGQEAKWERAIVLLDQFISREGHARVPKHHIEDGFKLGTWVMHQRHHYRQGVLPKEREIYLNKISGWAWFPMVTETEVDSALERSAPDEVKRGDVDELAEVAWQVLFGMGSLQRRTAAHKLAAVLHDTPLVKAHLKSVELSLMELMKEVLDIAEGYGFFDRPSRGHVRAILTDPLNYEPADWRMCLLSSLTEMPVHRDQIVRDVIAWARENVGLKSRGYRAEITVALGEAVEQALKAGELELIGENIIRKV